MATWRDMSRTSRLPGISLIIHTPPEPRSTPEKRSISLSVRPAWQIAIECLAQGVLAALVGAVILVIMAAIYVAIVFYIAVVALSLATTAMLWVFWVLVQNPLSYELVMASAWRTAFLMVGGAVLMSVFAAFGKNLR